LNLAKAAARSSVFIVIKIMIWFIIIIESVMFKRRSTLEPSEKIKRNRQV